MGTFLRHQDGTEQMLDFHTLGEGVTTEGGKIVIRHTWKEKTFPIGSQIKLTRHDLGEICFAFHLAASHVVTKMHEFALAQGIPDANLEETKDATSESPPESAPQNIDRED
jgi:hypothetical protein